MLEEVPRAGAAEVDEAVARAREALPGVARARARRAGRAAARARRRARGAPRGARRCSRRATPASRSATRAGRWGWWSTTFRYYAGAPERLLGDTIPVAGGQALTVREPLGVVGLIVPWNFPLTIAAWKLGPALAAGNTVVLKPAELTPLTALRFAELALEAGLPEGVVNVVVGPGRDVRAAARGAPGRRQDRVHRLDRGRPLDRRGRGGDDQARDARARRQVRRTSCSPTPTSRRPPRRRPRAVFGNAGPGLLRALADPRAGAGARRVHGAARGAVQAIRVGDPLDEATEMGPLISAGQRETVASFVDDDAPVAIRGSAPDGPGYWFPPTVLCPVAPDARAVREEIFGPVATVIPFDDEEDAVRLANDTIYGLSGSIWTRDGARALRVARAIEAGVLSINSNTSVRVATPFGGFKQSGYGRELGPHALDAYTEVKSIYYATLMRRLAGKVCVITGAARRHRRRDRRAVRARGRDAWSASTCSSTRSASSSLEADVTDEESVAAMYARAREELGRIDVLFNNAGISPTDDASVLDTTLEAWERVQAVNLRSVFLCCKHGIPHLLQERRRLGDQHRLVRRGDGRGDLADLLHRVEGRRARALARAGGRVRPPGGARQRAVPGPGRHAAAAGALRQGPRAGRAADGARADGPVRPRRGDRERRRCSWPATSRATSTPRRSSSTAGSPAPTRRLSRSLSFRVVAAGKPSLMLEEDRWRM